MLILLRRIRKGKKIAGISEKHWEVTQLGTRPQNANCAETAVTFLALGFNQNKVSVALMLGTSGASKTCLLRIKHAIDVLRFHVKHNHAYQRD